MAAGDVFRDVTFREEAGGYAPRAVDRALARWAKGDDMSADEFRQVRFRRGLRGYNREDVDRFLEAVANGHEPTSETFSSWQTLRETAFGGLVALAPFGCVFGAGDAAIGRVRGYGEIAASVVVLVLFLVRLGSQPRGAHSFSEGRD